MQHFLYILWTMERRLEILLCGTTRFVGEGGGGNSPTDMAFNFPYLMDIYFLSASQG